MVNTDDKWFQPDKKWFQPGIFRIECLKTKKAFFGESLQVFFEVDILLENLQNDVCSNKTLQADYKKYGPESFEIERVGTGPEDKSFHKRVELLAQFKNSWEGELYN